MIKIHGHDTWRHTANIYLYHAFQERYRREKQAKGRKVVYIKWKRKACTFFLKSSLKMSETSLCQDCANGLLPLTQKRYATTLPARL